MDKNFLSSIFYHYEQNNEKFFTTGTKAVDSVQNIEIFKLYPEPTYY